MFEDLQGKLIITRGTTTICTDNAYLHEGDTVSSTNFMGYDSGFNKTRKMDLSYTHFYIVNVVYIKTICKRDIYQVTQVHEKWIYSPEGGEYIQIEGV